MAGWYDWQGNDLLINVHIQPRARLDEICGVYGDALKIRITAPPVDGKANAHLVAFLAEQCELGKSAVTLVSGESSRKKRLRLHLKEHIIPVALSPFC